MPDEADALVIGAGPAGSAFASYFSRPGRRVLLLDTARFPRDKPCGEGILPPGAAVLRELGLGEELVARGAQCIRGVRYSLADGTSARASFPAPPAGHGDGLALRRQRLDALLSERARAQPGVSLLEGRRVTGLRRSPGSWQVRTSTGDEYAGRLLVGADGYRSTVRRLLGWQARPAGGRYGVVGHFRLPERGMHAFGDDVHVVLRRGVETYAAPVGERELLVALLGGRRLMRCFAGDREAAYLRLVSGDPVLGSLLRSGTMTPPVTACGPFAGKPAHVHAAQVLLIGDAAGFLDPITGEGLSRSLQGARLAARVAEQAFGRDDLSAAGLAPYAAGLRRFTRDSERLTRLALLLCSSEGIARLAMRGLRRDRQLLPRLLGIGAGAWGFGALSARDWLALLAGI